MEYSLPILLLLPVPFILFCFILAFVGSLSPRQEREPLLLPRHHVPTERRQYSTQNRRPLDTSYPSPQGCNYVAPSYVRPLQDWSQPILSQHRPIRPQPTLDPQRLTSPWVSSTISPPPAPSTKPPTFNGSYQPHRLPYVRPKEPEPCPSKVPSPPRRPTFKPAPTAAPSYLSKAKARENQIVPAPIATDDSTELGVESLRHRAWEAGDKKRNLLKAGKVARRTGNKKAAAELARACKGYEEEQRRLNQMACKKIFEENNKRCSANTIDLHGLYVPEAIEYTNSRLLQATRNRDSFFRIIVGKGLHSKTEAQLKPAVMEVLRKRGVEHELEPKNDGVILVYPTGKVKFMRTAC